MKIFMKKFGDVLTSRQSGKEAYAAFFPVLKEVRDGEEVIVDFEGINTFSPSWADEFLTPLQERFGDRLALRASENPSVALTLSLLERINRKLFRRIG